MACTPMSRTDTAVLVPSPYTSTRGVSPSGTQVTLPVQVWHDGLSAPGRQAVSAARAGTAVVARAVAATAMTAARRRSTGTPGSDERVGRLSYRRQLRPSALFRAAK